MYKGEGRKHMFCQCGPIGQWNATYTNGPYWCGDGGNQTDLITEASRVPVGTLFMESSSQDLNEESSEFSEQLEAYPKLIS